MPNLQAILDSLFFNFKINFDIDISSVTAIGNYAFYNCYFYKNIFEGLSIETIGDYAFSDIEIQDISLSFENCISIGNGAFANITTPDISLPSLTYW